MSEFASFLFQVLVVVAFFAVTGLCASLTWRFPWRVIKTRDYKLRVAWVYGAVAQAALVLAVWLSFVVWAYVHIN